MEQTNIQLPMIEEELPERITILSQSGLIILPNSTTPIIISQEFLFKIIIKSLQLNRLIGIVQPHNHNHIFKYGCLARISTFSETDKGLLIGLTGICRFHIQKKIKFKNLNKEITVSYKRFKSDLKKNNTINSIDRIRLFKALDKYLKNYNLITDWNELKNTPDYRLITAITIAAPFTYQEKQAILEIPNLNAQCCMVTTLIEMATIKTTDKIIFH